MPSKIRTMSHGGRDAQGLEIGHPSLHQAITAPPTLMRARSQRGGDATRPPAAQLVGVERALAGRALFCRARCAHCSPRREASSPLTDKSKIDCIVLPLMVPPWTIGLWCARWVGRVASMICLRRNSCWLRWRRVRGSAPLRRWSAGASPASGGATKVRVRRENRGGQLPRCTAAGDVWIARRWPGGLVRRTCLGCSRCARARFWRRRYGP